MSFTLYLYIYIYIYINPHRLLLHPLSSLATTDSQVKSQLLRGQTLLPAAGPIYTTRSISFSMLTPPLIQKFHSCLITFCFSLNSISIPSSSALSFQGLHVKIDRCKFYVVIMANFVGLDYSLDHHQHQHQHQQPRIGESCGDNNNGMVDYMVYTTPTSFDKLSFADVMQFADFGPKLALNQTRIPEDETGIDPSGYFLRFPVLNDKLEDESLMVPPSGIENVEELVEDKHREDEARVSDNAAVQLRFFGEDDDAAKNKRKRPRTIKTSEEESKEANERASSSVEIPLPGSYVQRGDQASIIGGAIEFVRELEQLLQCLESQKRRRLYGEASRQMGDTSMAAIQQQQQQQQQQQPVFPPMSTLPNDQMKVMEYETGLREETAENKSCLADVEVKLLGFDAMIKILCRRRPGQLVKTIAALEDLQLNILHTNITTIEQTVLYSFNVKVTSESGFSAEDIASSVQQIFSFIHANSSMYGCMELLLWKGKEDRGKVITSSFT
ncbi:hypothetical protein CXB51_025926 [Gossypium anomalum]|uniref:ACT domain-containing protein n=1 Tax=Gossypium anomalum TaxID=47600 RepID=A0A8J5YDE4_9ROSI|nr:hypothetical protein CXB51_025926 [Gossypium anomalum]